MELSLFLVFFFYKNELIFLKKILYNFYEIPMLQSPFLSRMDHFEDIDIFLLFIQKRSMALFASLIICTFQLVFSSEQCFSLTTNKPKLYFGLFFQRSEHGLLENEEALIIHYAVTVVCIS